MDIQLITGSTQLQMPAVVGDIKWTLQRRGTAGQLTFTVVQDETLSLTEGDPVALTVDGVHLFYGFVFTKKRSKDGTIEVTAYDQLRYLKNEDAVNFENKTASQLIQMLAADFELQCGDLDDTGYTIAAYGEESVTLFDAILDALDETMQATGQLYVLYDDFGKLTLKKIGSLKSNLLLDAETAENYSYESSIDTDTYNKVKLTYENEETGTRDVYIAQDSGNIGQWGVLQYHESLSSDEGAAAKADALLGYYNRKTRKLSFKNALGDLTIRAGSTVGVYLQLDDMMISNYMMVEKVTHIFSLDCHLMDLILIGGDFIA